MTAVRRNFGRSKDARSKKRAADAATAALRKTAEGPSTTLSKAITAKQPNAAPARSVAYTAPTSRGNRVSAKQTQMPLKTKGIVKKMTVKPTEKMNTRLGWGANGMLRWAKKLITIASAKSAEFCARCSCVRAFEK